MNSGPDREMCGAGAEWRTRGRVTHVRYNPCAGITHHGDVENLISFGQLSHATHQMHWHIGWLADWHNENITFDMGGRNGRNGHDGQPRRRRTTAKSATGANAKTS